MRSDSPLWRVLGEPAQAQEAEALEKLRDLLPDDGIARAWTNLTFTDSNGRLNEVDALVLTKAGLFVVELKGWRGEITGNQTTWYHAGRTEKNPRLLANTKAKRLASVLKDLAHTVRAPADVVPYIGEAIVMHGRGSKLRLDQYGAESVWALDGFNVQGLGPGRTVSDLLRDPGPSNVDKARANVIDKLMDAAGLIPRPRQRMIGQYPLESSEPLGEGPGWQDFLVSHPQAKVKRRIRLFPYPKGAGRDIQHAIDLRARREFQLTFGVNHPGIIGPAELLTTDEGPALLFAYDPDEMSLAAYLEARADTLTFEERERLVQDLVELVRFAHSQRLTHRALSPVSVRVKVSPGATGSIHIRDWDLARRPDDGTSTSTEISRGATDLMAQVDQEAVLYLAPETLRGQTAASPQTLDVYGVGALTALILTGKPPAANILALQELMASGAKGIDPRAQMQELPDEYAQVIIDATAFDEAHRTIDIAQFVDEFEHARSTVRAAVHPEPEYTTIDPLDAAVGDIVGERFEILKRRGSGSTGVALEVTDYDRDFEHVILKLAKDDAAAARLAVEAQVLDRLDHPRIVKRLDGPLTVGTRQGLLLSDAGVETLADRIRLEGKATIEQLERYALDLFDAVAHLESKGVFHRDIKPSNLAVKPDPGTRKPHVTLFDFSLAEEPLTNIRSGSKPYLDPYLGPTRPQYDSAAERFAIAATLFELAAGDPIWWEQGDAPSSPTDAPIVQATMFDPAIADGLVAFFRTALAPNAAERHASLDSMRTAWIAALAGAAVGEEDAAANDAKAAAAAESTPLDEAGLSARALSALARLDVATVGELLGVPPMQINQLRGLGEQVRREIQGRIREWRHRLASPTTVHDVVPEAPGRRAVEKFISTISVKPDETSEDRYKRLKRNQTLKTVTEDVARWVRELGNLATLDELSRRLLREYGSTLTDPQRTTAAVAVTRAAIELDTRSREPLFVIQMTRDRAKIAVAYAPEDGSGLTLDEAEEHLETLLHSASVVDQLLDQQELISAPQVREALLGDGIRPLRIPDTRLVQLAVSLSARGRLSSMGEVYRADFTPAKAVELALRGAPTRELAIQTIEQRVRARFPEIEAIPGRPALDVPVKAAMPHLEWLDDAGKYVTRAVETLSLASTNSATAWGHSAEDPAIVAKLKASIRDRAPLTLVVSRRQSLHVTATRLANQYGLTVVDLADVALTALKSAAAAKNVDWLTVLRADGEPVGSRGRRNLARLARAAITPEWAELMQRAEPLLLLNAAVLARFGLEDLIAGVTDLGRPRAAARWFLLPRPLSGSTPHLDGVPMPFGADGWLELSLEVPPAAGGGDQGRTAVVDESLVRKAPLL